MVPIKAASRPATERGEETRRRLLELAARAIAEHGYRGISLNDLIRSSGMTKGAFYFHFPSKQALAVAVFDYKQEQWAGKVLAAAMRNERAIDKLLAMPDALADIHETDPAARAVQRLCTELTDEDEMTAHFEDHNSGWLSITAQLLREAQAEGDVKPGFDPDELAYIAVSSVMGIEHLSDMLTGRADLRERIHQFMRLFEAAVRT